MADIAYLSTQSKFVYLRLVKDAYSRKFTDEHVHARKAVAAKTSRSAAGQQNGASGSADMQLGPHISLKMQTPNAVNRASLAGIVRQSQSSKVST